MEISSILSRIIHTNVCVVFPVTLRFYFLINTFALHLQDPDKGTQLHLGINHCGILTFQDSRKIQHFRWSEVQKINFEGKMFIVHVTINEVSVFVAGWILSWSVGRKRRNIPHLTIIKIFHTSFYKHYVISWSRISLYHNLIAKIKMHKHINQGITLFPNVRITSNNPWLDYPRYIVRCVAWN